MTFASASADRRPAERRRAGLRRRGLPAALPREPARPAAASSSTSWWSTTARPTSRARSPTGTPPRRPGSGSCTPTTTAWAPPATRGCGTSSGEYVGFADSDDVVPPRRTTTMLPRRWRTPAPTSSPGRSSGGRPTGSASRRGCAGCTTPARAGVTAAEHPEILGDVFAWNKLFRRTFWDVGRALLARGDPLRGPADHDPRLPGRPVRRAARGRLPLADPRRRLLDHPAAGLGRRPRGPAGDQADGAGAASTRHRTRPRSGRTSWTGCWPATCTATSC